MFGKSVFILVGVSLLWSCSQPVKPVREPVKPDFVGVVDRVYPEQKYVLVRIGGVFPSAGTTLIAHAPEGQGSRVANLVVSPERLGNLRVPADIRSGAVEGGDLVFIYRGLAAPEAPDSPDQQEDVVAVSDGQGDVHEEKKEEPASPSFPPGLPPGADGLLPSANDHELPSHHPAPPVVTSATSPTPVN